MTSLLNDTDVEVWKEDDSEDAVDARLILVGCKKKLPYRQSVSDFKGRLTCPTCKSFCLSHELRMRMRLEPFWWNRTPPRGIITLVVA
ncbi:hypothetical protein CRG98_035885 [Punica granatum]|uniref:Uncharacterized protein n=1 Tax=Punica granatum TaxID=22663 RepID=A0A2I0IIY3_PUNGR|nr:hypothetical protein CRG98_035885 [Punica granatum]